MGKRPGRVSAAAKSMRRFRAVSPRAAAYRERERKRLRARNEALSALARRHPAEFAELFDAELVYAGLEPRHRKEGPWT